MGKGESLETLEQPTLFHSFKKHLLSACQALRSKYAKDPLTISAAMEAGQRDQHPSKGIKAQGRPHVSLQMLILFKPV